MVDRISSGPLSTFGPQQWICDGTRQASSMIIRYGLSTDPCGRTCIPDFKTIGYSRPSLVDTVPSTIDATNRAGSFFYPDWPVGRVSLIAFAIGQKDSVYEHYSAAESTS